MKLRIILALLLFQHMLMAQVPMIQGHRGCRGLFPENSLPAFAHALEIGVRVLEMDVCISADGQVVVSHVYDEAGWKSCFEIRRSGIEFISNALFGD